MIRPRRSARSLPLSVALVLASAVAAGGDPPPRPSEDKAGDRPRPAPFVMEKVTAELPSQPARITLAKREYRPLEPIVVDFEAQNRTKPGLRWDLQVGVDHYIDSGLVVAAPGSKPAAETAYARSQRHRHYIGKGHEFYAGDKLQYRFAANLLRDMTAPGEYTIDVAMPIYAYLPDGRLAKGVLRADPVKVVVKGPPITKGE